MIGDVVNLGDVTLQLKRCKKALERHIDSLLECVQMGLIDTDIDR